MGWATHYIERLLAGETVSFRPRGHSMVPKIHSGQLCTVEPVDTAILAVDDIVLCKVTGEIISSGVAAYEPSLGGDEISVRHPEFFDDEKRIWAPNDPTYFETWPIPIPVPWRSYDDSEKESRTSVYHQIVHRNAALMAVETESFNQLAADAIVPGGASP